MKGYARSIFLFLAMKIATCFPFCNNVTVVSEESCCIPTCTNENCVGEDPCPGSLFYTPMNLKLICSSDGKIKNITTNDVIGMSRFCSIQCRKDFWEFNNSCVDCKGLCETETPPMSTEENNLQSEDNSSQIIIIIVPIVVVVVVIAVGVTCWIRKRRRGARQNSLEAISKQTRMDILHENKDTTYENAGVDLNDMGRSTNSYVKDPTRVTQEKTEGSESEYNYAEYPEVPRSAFVDNENEEQYIVPEDCEQTYTNKEFLDSLNGKNNNTNLPVEATDICREDTQNSNDVSSEQGNHDAIYSNVNSGDTENVEGEPDNDHTETVSTVKTHNQTSVKDAVEIKHAENVTNVHCKVDIEHAQHVTTPVNSKVEIKNADAIYINVHFNNDNKNINENDDKGKKKTNSL